MAQEPVDIPMAAHEEPASPELRKVDILVCDDLPEKILVYRSVLEELGQNLICANSGEEALKLVLQHDFAVIMLDVNMPGMDGFETASLIRQRRKSAKTPIIFLTAFVDDVHAAQGYASGAVDYLLTPVMPEILKAKVRVFIELHQMRQQVAHQAEEHARRMAAEEADRRKDAFLGMLAHELRNPLGPIRNATHLLQQYESDDPQLGQLRSIIDRQVTHMTKLVDDLLDSTRLASGKMLLRKERCDLARITKFTAEDYRSIFESHGLKLVLDLPSTPVWTNGDPTRIRQMVGNLLQNADKFTASGGEVLVSLRIPQDGTAEVAVKDTGIGIDAAMLPHIFEVFQQAEQGLDRSRGGLGLGLTLVKGLAGLHGGTITAASDGIGKGATLTLRLPVESGASAQANNAADDDLPENTVIHRILIIEDSIDAAETTRMVLEREGHDVRIASTGLEGIATAHDFKPNIILCDIGLPGIDGYQVAKRLRQDPALSDTYVIALTGYGREKDRKLAEEAGFNEHMTKPIDFPILRRTLTQLPGRAVSGTAA
ncbi:MAG: response regulator [Alphaproteobacteria bacterium]